MTVYTDYSATPADNDSPPPVGAPEGMYPSAVNDTMREMMSVVRQLGDQTQSTFGALGSMSSQNANAANITGGTIGGSTAVNTTGAISTTNGLFAGSGISTNGGLTANGVFTSGGLHIDPANSWGWSMYRDSSSADHYEQHVPGNYEVWRSGGQYEWFAFNTRVMSLDGGGNLAVHGTVTPGGVLLSVPGETSDDPRADLKAMLAGDTIDVGKVLRLLMQLVVV